MTTDEEIEHYSFFWVEPEKYLLTPQNELTRAMAHNHKGSAYVICYRLGWSDALASDIPSEYISEIIQRMLLAGVEIVPKVFYYDYERDQRFIDRLHEFCLVKSKTKPHELDIYHKLSEAGLWICDGGEEAARWYQAIAQQMLAAGAELLDKYPEPKRPHLKKVQRLVWWQHWVAQVKRLFHHL